MHTFRGGRAAHLKRKPLRPSLDMLSALAILAARCEVAQIFAHSIVLCFRRWRLCSGCSAVSRSSERAGKGTYGLQSKTCRLRLLQLKPTTSNRCRRRSSSSRQVVMFVLPPMTSFVVLALPPHHCVFSALPIVPLFDLHPRHAHVPGGGVFVQARAAFVDGTPMWWQHRMGHWLSLLPACYHQQAQAVHCPAIGLLLLLRSTHITKPGRSLDPPFGALGYRPS